MAVCRLIQGTAKVSSTCGCCRTWLVGLTILMFCLEMSLGESKDDTKDASRYSLEPGAKKPGKQNDSPYGVFTQIADGFYLTDGRQDKVNPQAFGGIIMSEEARRVATRLRYLSNEEIGVLEMQGIYDAEKNEKEEVDEKAKLLQIVKRLHDRFHNYLQVLNTNKVTVENLYRFHAKHPITLSLDCCSLPLRDLKSDNQYGCRISRRTSCDLLPPNVPFGAFNPGRNLTEVWRGNMQYFPSLKWQYFISVDGVHNEYPSTNYHHVDTDCQNIHDLQHSEVFLSTVQPWPKHLVIIMDHGNSLSANQLVLAKAIAKHLFNIIADGDMVSVLGLASKVSYPREDRCLPHTLAPFSLEARLLFSKFIDNLEKQDTATNHSLGFQEAFEIIENSLKTEGTAILENTMIIYISRGLLSSLTEAREVMEMIATHNSRTQHKVIINTYAVIDDGKPIMYEKSFMQDIASQNFPNYDVQYNHDKPPPKGTMMAINTTRDLGSTVGRFYLSFNNTTPTEPVFLLPVSDLADQALTLSLSQPCFYEGSVVGVVGVDLHMEDIAQDITYYNQGDGSYAFIIDTAGYTIMHPSVTRPLKTSFQPMHTDIRHYEYSPGFERIRTKMIRDPEGEQILKAKRQGNATESEPEDKKFAKYIWKKLENSPYIVVIKVFSNNPVIIELKDAHLTSSADLMYHRLDLLTTDNIHMCMHMKQVATLGMSSLFLSASSFKEPYEHLSQQETKRMVKGYLAYLKDNTRLIANPGLKDKIRDDVAVISKINSNWLRRVKAGTLDDFILRRYIATPSGVMSMYPGTLLDRAYDPTKRMWFQRALEFPAYVTMTAPYLDSGGGGYIVTIAHTIFEGRQPPLHSDWDQVMAVMGMDVTMGYFYKLMAENIPACEQPNIRCFMMDNQGYLIAHPGLIEAYGKGPLEQQHITHKEPLVANDILNHKGFVTKRLCNRYSDRTIQRFYNFSTSLDVTLTNLVHGEHCSRYQIAAVPGTNTFIGIVNQTCDMATAFCPCSMVDRLCLNCHRMEQNECECPCECQLEMNFCTGKLLDDEDLNPSCHPVPEATYLALVDSTVTANLEQCFKVNCEERTSKLDCLGVVDCEWCQSQPDGKTPLTTPYCASQRVCFGGVVGAITPYGDQVRFALEEEESIVVKTTPVGPVAGGIMGCFLVLALGVYCYRHHVHRNNRQYITTIQENPNRMSHYYNEPEDFEIHEEPGTGHTNIVLASFENPASISPYRVNTSYRRPAGGDSDHGYSTMTPHEDSEHASLPCLEPLIIGKDRYKPAPYPSTKTPTIPPPPSSTSRRSRSPTPPQTRIGGYSTIPEQTSLPPQTVLPNTIPEASNSILANVQVHMVDTH
ncbi:VWFA and cache domain-containing protein 1-like [Liolophura sinensis]|uniref:VWFA and cache domain-containing protein 1-like n=1 Tax=Liolophura sinensis TaxID=3198878 RepID=UPI0031585D4D